MTRRDIGAFILTALLFGGTFVAVKAGLAYLPPLLFLAIRFDIGAAVLAGYALSQSSWSDLQPQTRDDVYAIVATGGLVIGLTNVFLFLGQRTTTSGLAAIIFSLTPIVTVAFATVLLSDMQPTSVELAGITIGLFGVVLVVGPESLLTGESEGVLFLIAGVITISLGTVAIRLTDSTLSTAARTVWGVPLAAIISHILSLVAGESTTNVVVTPAALVAVAYVGVGSGAIAYLAYFRLVDSIGPRQGNLVFYAIPIVSAVGGWALLAESLNITTLLGFGVVAVGSVVIVSQTIKTSQLRSLIPQPMRSPEPPDAPDGPRNTE